MNGRIILSKGVATGIKNWMLWLRVSKLDQYEALLVAITEYPSVLAQPYGIFELTIDAATTVTREGVVWCVELICSGG